MTRIPLPGSNPAEPFQRGVEQGTGMFNQLLGLGQQQAQAAQQWEQHLRNAAIREQQEERLRQLQPYLIAEHENKINMQPLNLEHLKAKIDYENAKAEKARKAENPDKAARAAQLRTPWANMTTTQRENMAALANGLGIRPDVFVEGMTAGKTLEDIAEEQGLDRKAVTDVIPKYLATASNATAENERQKGLAEMEVFDKKVTEWMAPYIRKVGGMSPKQIVDTLKGENIDDLAKYYAALAVQPEMGALKIKVMGGNMSHAAMEDIIKANFGRSNINESMVGPEVYKKMSHYLSELLHEGSKAATQSVYGRPALNNKEQKPSAYEESQRQLAAKSNSESTNKPVRKRLNPKTNKMETV